MLSEHDFRRRMFETVATVVGVAIVLAALWAAREALMLGYISALIAMGFSPLVGLIERPRAHRRRVPRWGGILGIYSAIHSFVMLCGLAVIPPLVARAEAPWRRMPSEVHR